MFESTPRHASTIILEFLVGGILAVIFGYITQLILKSYPADLAAKTPILISVLPYLLYGVGVFLLVACVVTIVLYLR